MEKAKQIQLKNSSQQNIENTHKINNNSLIKRIFKLTTSKAFLKQGFKFAIVGAIGTLVNLSILYLLTDMFGLLYLISESIAFVVATINNYILNKVNTFDENIQEKIVGKGIKYILICILSLIVNLVVLFIVVEYFNVFYILAELFAICCAFSINFLGNRFWTFRHEISRTIETEKIKKIAVESIIAFFLILLGTFDLISGFIKNDILFFLLAIPLIIIGFSLIFKIILIKKLKLS